MQALRQGNVVLKLRDNVHSGFIFQVIFHFSHCENSKQIRFVSLRMFW